jgi:hypothetical protein
MMADLASTGIEARFGSGTRGRKIYKYSNYFEIYDRYLAAYKGHAPTIMEIGVQHGGSLLLWDTYFDGKASIVGIDILQDCKRFEDKNVRIFIGDQSDKKFLGDVIAKMGKVDIIVDDGSHIPSHQIKTFEVLFFNALADNGIYICEDCHTSYWRRYGGGLRHSGSFVEYAKKLCDQLNAWGADDPALVVNEATKWIKSIAFFSSVVVFEKAPISEPRAVSAGDEGIDVESPFRKSKYASLVLPLKRSSLVQGLVRRNPFLWRIMRRLLEQNQ